ncbi:hypothetical protein BKA60DRAFT_625778 [Fusarium oxysporum]|nr:hypothetical protein BKA60DRAFT_625778 [Fusarium oxysporum]
MPQSPIPYFGLSCPSGGAFHICEGANTEFIGCCTSDPCAGNKGTCPDGHLRVATFSADTYNDLPRQDCDDPRGTEIWYTCRGTSPPFMGCCGSNPCGGGGCNRSELVPAILSSNENDRLSFLHPDTSQKASLSSTVISISTSSTEASSSTPSSTTYETSQINSGGAAVTANAGSNGNGSGGLGIGAVAGIAVGATIGAMVIIGLLIWRFFWIPRKKRKGELIQEVKTNEYFTQTSGASTFSPHQSPSSNCNHFLVSNQPAAYHPSGTTADMYNTGTQMHPPQEMDPTTTVIQELGTGEEQHFPASA